MQVKVVDELLIRIEFAVVGQIPSDLHREVAAIHVEDILVDVPGANDGDVAVEVGLLVEPFEHRDVWVGAVVVRINFRVGETGEHFVVAGIGKGLAVGDASDAAFELIAEELALRGDDTPEKRE